MIVWTQIDRKLFYKSEENILMGFPKDELFLFPELFQGILLKGFKHKFWLRYIVLSL